MTNQCNKNVIRSHFWSLRAGCGVNSCGNTARLVSKAKTAERVTVIVREVLTTTTFILWNQPVENSSRMSCEDERRVQTPLLFTSKESMASSQSSKSSILRKKLPAEKLALELKVAE